MRQRMSREAARRKLVKFLHSAFRLNDEWEAYVEFWEPGPWGIRLAEIGAVSKDRSCGSTYFRSDDDAAYIFLRCEDLLTQWMFEVGPDEDIKWWKKEIRQWVKTGRSTK